MTNSPVNTDTEDTPPPQSCPPNSLSCKDSVSGRTAISEKVNSGWPSRLGPSGTPEEARGPRRVPLQKEGGELVRNSVPSPAGCILDPAELLKHRGQPSRFLAIQESNPMLPPRWWHQQNTPPPPPGWQPWLRHQVGLIYKKSCFKRML